MKAKIWGSKFYFFLVEPLVKILCSLKRGVKILYFFPVPWKRGVKTAEPTNQLHWRGAPRAPDYMFYEAMSHLNINNHIISSTKYNIICLNINAASALQNDHNCRTCIAKLYPCTHNQLTKDLPVSEGKSVDQSTYLKVKDISDKAEHMLILFVCFITKSFLTYSFFFTYTCFINHI